MWLNGGLGYFGFLWGALVFTAVYLLITKQSCFKAIQLYTPFLAIWHGMGWLACWFEGCAYGRTAFISWNTAELPDSYGIWEIRYQTQVAGFMLCTILFLIWWRIDRERKWPEWPTFWLSLATVQLIYFGLTFWRGDDIPDWGNLRADSWFALITLVICLVPLFFKVDTDLSPHP